MAKSVRSSMLSHTHVIVIMQVERVLPVASALEKKQFSSKKALHKVADHHLWYSIFSRPPSQRFTRVQRCTCCFVLLLLSMCLNILYYDQSKSNSTATNGIIRLGPIEIPLQQVGNDTLLSCLVR
jgi:uncharacterized membrane protein